jgi:hypothetical protein
VNHAAPSHWYALLPNRVMDRHTDRNRYENLSMGVRVGGIVCAVTEECSVCVCMRRGSCWRISWRSR